LFNENKRRDDLKLRKCVANNIDMVYIIDNEKYLDKRYHINAVEPFSSNVSYKIMHIDHFENYLNRLVDDFTFFGLK
jgi:hypothetical protein